MENQIFQNRELQLIFQLALAMALGWLIGWERSQWKKPAGGRTFMLIALGSCLFSIITIESINIFPGDSPIDPTRIASTVLTGIGFIGAGIILQKHGHVEGITSAAALWVAAAVGMAVAFQFYMLAAITSLLTVFGLNISYATRKIFSRVSHTHSEHHEGEE